jgi:transposase-like protein
MPDQVKDGAKWWRYPPTAAGIQVNHCKNPLCANFGVPPYDKRPRRRAVASAKGHPLLRCEICKSHFPMQSNLAIAEELVRISKYLDPDDEPSCPNQDCVQYGVAATSPGASYYRFGKTPSGTPRYQCAKCKSTFSKQSRSTLRQRKTHKNRDVFMLLVNKSPMKRIAAVTDLSVETVYRKIDFIHKQCLQFSGERERSLTECDWPTRYIATDRQMFIVNWTSRKDRRNVQLLAIASADVESGYVFGMHLNFDGEMNETAVHSDMLRYGDQKLARPFRRYARVWLKQDYMNSKSEAKSELDKKREEEAAKKLKGEAALDAKIADVYADAAERDDVESVRDIDAANRFPAKGMQVHEQCSMHAHVHLVTRLLRRAKKLRFFMDQESGLRAAFMAAVPERIRDRTADAWYVKVLKEVKIDAKRRAVKEVKNILDGAKLKYPELSQHEIELLLMKEEMRRAKEMGQWNDRWLAHPLPNMSEPAKKICWLTDLNDYDEDHAARLYLKASLHPVDRFFMQVRRKLSMAERPISSATNTGRVWNGYSAYQPANLVRILEIFRVFYNYCEPGEDKKTPAMRLGLAKGPVPVEQILYFVADRDVEEEVITRVA